MKTKSNIRNINKIFLCNKEEAEFLEKVAKKMDTYEAEIVREGLKLFYEKNGFLKE